MDKNDLNTPLYNSRIIDTYIKLIRHKYSFINISELLHHANMEQHEVADQGHWFTQEQINLFHERLVQLTGKDNIAREAGRYSASPEAVGAMRQYVLGLMSPAKVYDIIGKATSNFTRSCRYVSRRLGPNQYEIQVIPNEGVQENEYQCENRKGFFEAISIAFNNKLPQIEHPECIFKGGKCCRYIISWDTTTSDLWKRFRLLLAVFFSLSIVPLTFFVPGNILALLGLGIVIILFSYTFVIDRLEKRELKSSITHLRSSSDDLLNQIEINYNHALMVNEIGQAISRPTNIEEVLSEVIRILKTRLGYDRSMILLADSHNKHLIYRAGYGYSVDQVELLSQTSFHLDKSSGRGIFITSYHERKPFLINDLNDIEGLLSPRSVEFAKKIGAQSFICCPIICDGTSIGILAVDNYKSQKLLVQSDMSLVMGIAPMIGISIRNARLLQSRDRMFKSTIKTLSASIDARDPLTAGHSEKVTEYALGICREMGYAKKFCDMLQVAALLHDYGKIGVPDAILKKPGKLTEEERIIVRLHAAKTEEILRQINFEGEFKTIPETAGSHHERIDGMGYPKGLKGDEILLGAKIIAVADYIEALTAKRHYREPMPFDDALQLLRDKSGKYFEKELVDAFFKYYKKTHRKKKKALKLLTASL